MSYNYGAGKPERVKKTFFLILAFSFGFTTIASWLILLFPKTFIMPFTDSQRLIEITIPAIRIYFGGMMFIGVLYACQRTFMALGRTKLSLLGAMMRKLCLLYTSPLSGGSAVGSLKKPEKSPFRAYRKGLFSGYGIRRPTVPHPENVPVSYTHLISADFFWTNRFPVPCS